MKLASLVVVAVLGGVAHADRPEPARRQAMRQFLLQNFDRNGDGRLEPRERKHAAKVLRRLAKRMQAGQQQRMSRQQQGAAKRQRFIQRFDLNHDGNVGPNEMPPDLADELRPLDRDGDGWLEDNELP